MYTKGQYLKDEIEKLINKEINDINSEMNNDNISIYQKNIIFDKEKFKEDIKEKEKNNETINDVKKENKDIEILKINKKKESNNAIKSNKKNINIGHKENSKYFNNFIKGEKNQNKKNEKINVNENLSEHKKLDSKDVLVKKLSISEEKQSNNMNKIESDKISNKTGKESKLSDNGKGDLTDFELNDLEYEEALELDNRSFFNIYWYLIKREHSKL